MHRKTFRKASEYECLTACPIAVLIASVMPGTVENVPFVIPWKRAGVLDGGRPAGIAASGTYCGIYFAASVVSIEEYILVATTGVAVQIAPITPAIRPILSGSHTSAIIERVRFSM